MRHLMEPDPEAPTPSLKDVLWLYALILAAALYVAAVATGHV